MSDENILLSDAPPSHRTAHEGEPVTEAEKVALEENFVALVRAEEVRVKPLLLSNADDATKIEAADHHWGLIGDEGRGGFLLWCYLNHKRVGVPTFSRMLAQTWTRPKIGSLVTQWGFTRKLVTEMFESAAPEHLMTAEEFAIFNSLRSEIVAYRGCARVTVGQAKKKV
jgi:hypothetical protein